MNLPKTNRPMLVHRVLYVVAMTATASLLTGASWEIDAPPSASTRTKTSSVAGNGTAGQAGVAVLQFGPNKGENGGYIIENEMNVTAQSIGMGMFSWSGNLSAPTGGWSESAPIPGMPGMFFGIHEARIEWTEGTDKKHKETILHIVTP